MSHEEYNKQGEHKPHFHFFFKVDNIKTFNNCVKTIKIKFDLFNLGKQIREKTGKKGYRNYGVHKKEIYDENYFKQYICKDKNVWGNYPKDEIQTWIDASFKSVTDQEFKEKVYDYTNQNYKNQLYKDICHKSQINSNQVTHIKLCIMEYMRNNNSTITRTKVNNHFNYFLTKNMSFSLGDIFNILDI